jgi:hypothetical protein
LGNSWLFPSPFAFSKSTGNGFLQWTIYIHIYVYIYIYVRSIVSIAVCGWFHTTIFAG